MLVLKRLDDARRDGDRIYAVIRSIGQLERRQGAGGLCAVGRGAGQGARAGVPARPGSSPATVELVEAHGTGTKVGDAIELAALEEVYRAAAAEGSWCALGSVKSQVGHTKAAAGAAGLIKAALALHHKVLPPTSKVRRPIEPLAGGSSPFYLSAPRRALAAARRASSPRGRQRVRVRRQQFPLRARRSRARQARRRLGRRRADPRLLERYAAEITAALAVARKPARLERNSCRGIAEPRCVSRASHRFRVLLGRRNGARPTSCAMAAAARARLESLIVDGSFGQPYSERHRSAALTESGRVFVGVGPAPGRLAMLFPGQGSQYVGMLRELACRFPRMQAALAVANELCAIEHEPACRDRIYPPTAFDEATRQRPGTGPARHAVRTAGDRSGQPGTAADPRGFRGSPRPDRGAQLRRADRAVRGRPD